MSDGFEVDYDALEAFASRLEAAQGDSAASRAAADEVAAGSRAFGLDGAEADAAALSARFDETGGRLATVLYDVAGQVTTLAADVRTAAVTYRANDAAAGSATEVVAADVADVRFG